MSLFKTKKPLITIRQKKKYIEVETNISLIDEIKLYGLEKKYNKINAVDQKYEKYWKRHYEILNLIQFDYYPKAINSKNIFNDYAFACIKLGYEDLSLAPYIIQWHNEKIIAEKRNHYTLGYGSHKYLIKILEKQEKYAEAIDVCNKYIELNLIDDGTKRGIIERKNRITKKLNK